MQTPASPSAPVETSVPTRLAELDPILRLLFRRRRMRPWVLAMAVLTLFTIGLVVANALQGTLVAGRTPSPLLHPDWFHHYTIVPVLLPLFFGLLLATYARADTMHAELVARGVLALKSEESDASAAMRRVASTLRSRRIDAAIGAGGLAAALLWLRGIARQPTSNWQHVTPGSVTPAAVYQVVVACLLACVVVRSIVAVVVFLLETKRVFRGEREFLLRLRPLHPDGCGGLQPIASFVLRLSLLLFVVGLMLAAYVIAGAHRHGSFDAALATGGPLVMLVCYGISAPLLFFLPLWPVHGAMRREKAAVLDQLSHAYDAQFELAGRELAACGLRQETTGALERIHTLYGRAAAMPVWPFSPGVLVRFLLTVVIPVSIPILARSLAKVL